MNRDGIKDGMLVIITFSCAVFSNGLKQLSPRIHICELIEMNKSNLNLQASIKNG